MNEDVKEGTFTHVVLVMRLGMRSLFPCLCIHSMTPTPHKEVVYFLNLLFQIKKIQGNCERDTPSPKIQPHFSFNNMRGLGKTIYTA